MTIKVTQRMLDYINEHKERNDDGILYNRDFDVEFGETCEIAEAYKDGMLMLRREKFGDSFCIPADVAGVDYDEVQNYLMLNRCHEDYVKSIDWNDVRIRAAIAALQGVCSDGGIWNSSLIILAEQSVKVADWLVAELKKEKEMPTIRQKE